MNTQNGSKRADSISSCNTVMKIHIHVIYHAARIFGKANQSAKQKAKPAAAKSSHTVLLSVVCLHSPAPLALGRKYFA